MHNAHIVASIGSAAATGFKLAEHYLEMGLDPKHVITSGTEAIRHLTSSPEGFAHNAVVDAAASILGFGGAARDSGWKR